MTLAPRHARRLSLWLLVGIGAGALVGSSGPPDGGSDRLGQAISDWTRFIDAHPDSGEDWKQIRQICQPLLETARTSLAHRRRAMALSRVASAWPYLSAMRMIDSLRAAGPLDSATLAAEWRRMGSELAPELAPPTAEAFAAARPAVARAIGEAARLQVRAFYEASRVYGDNTEPDAGLFYLGMARAARDLSQWTRTLTEPRAGPEPRFRSLTPEIEAFEHDMEAAYRPPASVEHHADFIAAHSALNDARSLENAGLVRGALLRYLQARLRFAPVRASVGALDTARVASHLATIARRIAAEGRDHSIASQFLEVAAADREASAPGAGSPTATAIANDVLPAYFAAIGPPPPPRAERAPEATITLVRWPYT
jgi:hypothetical protein